MKKCKDCIEYYCERRGDGEMDCFYELELQANKEAEEKTYLQSFRNQAAKDILTGIVAHSGVSISSTDAHRLTELALTYADELIRQLKEKET